MEQILYSDEMHKYTGQSILDEFKIYLENNPDNTLNYISEHGLDTEINDIITLNSGIDLLQKLTKFSMKYGILSILRFIYEYINFPFDINYINHFTDTQDLNSKQSAYVRNEYLIVDAYYAARSQCIIYITNMKKYSRAVNIDTHFYYIFNAKKYAIHT